jgi:RNA polymerase sigma-70 factor (ECF subfamily)
MASARNSRKSQKMIYNSFYGYAIAICKRYSSNHDDAVEMLNEGFLKMFKKIHHFTPGGDDVITLFQNWLRDVFVYSAIEYFKKNYRHEVASDPDSLVYQIAFENNEHPEQDLDPERTIEALQGLSPICRVVFNLFVIEGLDHDEIAAQLNISIAASQLNLSHARSYLQSRLFNKNSFPIEVAVKRTAGR